MIKTIATTIALSIISTTAMADKCGFMCKLAYGGGYDTVAEAKTAWEDKTKASAAKKMEATGKSAIVQGNYVFVEAAGNITMIAKTDLAGKSKAQVKATIIEAVGADLVDIAQNDLKAAIASGDEAAAETILNDFGIDPSSFSSYEEAAEAANAAGLDISAIANANGFDEATAQAADEAASKAEAIAEGLNVEQIYDDAVSADDIANGTAVDPVTGAPIN